MVARNSVTGDKIQTKGVSDQYRNNYDAIFGKKEENDVVDEKPRYTLDELLAQCDLNGESEGESVWSGEDSLVSGSFYVVEDKEGKRTVAQWYDSYGGMWWSLAGTDEDFLVDEFVAIREVDLS